MARIRTVKPDLFRHEGLFEAEQESGLPLRYAFIGIFTVADRSGIFRWQPRQIKLDVMPYDNVDFSRVLDALATRGFIVRYMVGPEEYGVIPSFTRHQVINNREKATLFPTIELSDAVWPYENKDLATRGRRVNDASSTPLKQDQGEGKGREGKGREGEGKGNSTRQASKPSQSAQQMIDLVPGLSQETAEEYLAFRKAKKAPLTPGAWKIIAKEISKSGMRPDDAINTAMARGWQGFEASWLQNTRSNGPVNRQQQIEDANAAVVREVYAREQRREQEELGLAASGEAVTLDGEVIRAE